jgi:hypothetical protein
VDIRYFFSQRLDFIRQLYLTASAPYLERIRKIESEEEPFVPPYSEDYDEPPFLEEWIEAEESLHVLAYSCVSMLAAALHLYLETWVRQSGIPVNESLKKSVFRKCGWLTGYNDHFSTRFSIDFEACPVKLGLLEEVILARNRIEHPVEIFTTRTKYADADLRKLRHPFFVDKREAVFLSDDDKDETAWLSPPTLYVTEEKLLAVLTEVERFVEWFENEIEKRVNSR